MNVLVACEESQRVCEAFRRKGHNAFSCDLVPCSGGYPEWHIQDDVLPLLDGNCAFYTCDGKMHFVERWELIIAHPPCTYLTCTGNRWFDESKYGVKAVARHIERILAIDFFLELWNADCPRIAIENPVGVMSTVLGKPNQVVHPFMFGDQAEKRTCLWLKGLPCLVPTDVVKPPDRIAFASGKTMPAWYVEAWKLPKEERAALRSKTFQGIATAMAEQWG